MTTETITSFWSIWGSSIVSIIGFGITLFVMRRQFKNGELSKVSEERRKVYVDCYLTVKELDNKRELIFDRKYINRLIMFRGEMDLIASQQVRDSYERLLQFIFVRFMAYEEKEEKLNPYADAENYETIRGELTGKEAEIYHGEMKDLDEIKEEVKSCMQTILPTEEEIRQYTFDIVKNMRIDFGSGKLTHKY